MESNSQPLTQGGAHSSNDQNAGPSNHFCGVKLQKSKTLCVGVDVQSAYKQMMMLKSFLIKLDLLARKKDASSQHLRAAILLTMTPLIDNIRGVTEFLEIINLKEQIKMKKRKYRLKMKEKKENIEKLLKNLQNEAEKKN